MIMTPRQQIKENRTLIEVGDIWIQLTSTYHPNHGKYYAAVITYPNGDLLHVKNSGSKHKNLSLTNALIYLERQQMGVAA
jgi:hypothetical protein